MTPLDDLRVGQYVALVDCKRDQQVITRKGGLWIDAEEVNFDGAPLKVAAISLPFICVDHPNGQRVSIDVRAWNVKRVSRHYATAMLANLRPAVAGNCPAANPGAGHCPRCGSKLVQRLVGDGKWIPVCPECDKSQPPAKKGVVIQ